MIGLKYPEIHFEYLKKNYLKGMTISSFIDFLTELEKKLIYLEKEINATKLNSFYTTRNLYLNKYRVKYDDSRIKEYHDIINWLIIHKSTQLKGIASDKYLACKYVKIKLGINLCPQRIGVFNSVDEIDFEKLVKMGNVVLKVSNGFSDNIFIDNSKNLSEVENIKKKVIFHFNREYALMTPSFSHLFTKKRIVLEKIFIPRTDLFEFRFFVFNNNIKMIIWNYLKNLKIVDVFYDENFNSILDVGEAYYNASIFNKNILEQMKDYAIKLSEDFPNFIRVDLYVFHDKIYLSELTFDSHGGLPLKKNLTYFFDGIKNWNRVE